MEYHKGYRSYGDDIPGYAQGAYFPGDEPGTFCKISGELCYLEDDAATPTDCEFQEPINEKCPDCDAYLYRNGNDVVFCQECGVIQ